MIKIGSKLLKKQNISSHIIDSEILLSKTLKRSREEILINPDQKVNKKNILTYKKYLKRRSKNEPIAYILGEKEFWSKKFDVSRDTLIPRPETELLVDKIKDLTIKSRRSKIKILDLGTGSGCILISLYLELKNKIDIYGVGIDICENALKIAKKNAILQKVQKNLIFLNSNWFSNIYEKFDLIVSNPPYIRNCDIEKLSPEVKKFDPFLALNGGKDGLECYRIISKSAKKYLNPGGLICVEIGNNQSSEVKKIFNTVGFQIYKDHKDYSNIRRVMIFKNKILIFFFK